MEVVLFCGGYGMRMRDGVSDVPEPMQTVGPRPLLWHVVRYYAHFGHTDFVLCLGYGAEHVKDYFLNYSETGSNDFVLRRGEVEVLGSDIADWTIHVRAHRGRLVDRRTAAPGAAPRGGRGAVPGELRRCPHRCAARCDGVPVPPVGRRRRPAGGAPAGGVPLRRDRRRRRVTAVSGLRDLPIWENGGYFVLRPEIFDHIPEGGCLVEDACAGLARAGRLLAHRHRGFWQPADTAKERMALEAAYRDGTRPWMLWEQPYRDPLEAAIDRLRVRAAR